MRNATSKRLRATLPFLPLRTLLLVEALDNSESLEANLALISSVGSGMAASPPRSAMSR